MTGTIEVVAGAGDGPTELAAFDDALAAAGAHNYNLVQFSSVIPRDRAVEERHVHDQRFPVGTPVGVVLARGTGDTEGEEIAAGLGWISTDGGGIFYESHGSSVDRCIARIEDGLEHGAALRGFNESEDVHIRTCTHTVEEAGCALVIAIFGSLPLEDRR